MFGTKHYFGLTRKYITLFGTLFNDIRIDRVKDDDTVQTVKVPLTYSSHDKMLARLNGDPNLDKKVAAISPAISFEVGTPVYDPDRKLQSLNKRCVHTEDGNTYQYVGAPYNLDFTLRIYAKNEEDGWRIYEQIVPYFAPSLSVSVMLIPELNYKADIPIVLESTDFQNNSYGEMQERRTLVWELRFVMKAEYLGPIHSGGKIIRTIHVNIRDKKSTEIMEEVHIEPGLTANGQPTTVKSESIPIEDIFPDDNYGYVVDINEGPNPHV